MIRSTLAHVVLILHAIAITTVLALNFSGPSDQTLTGLHSILRLWPAPIAHSTQPSDGWGQP